MSGQSNFGETHSGEDENPLSAFPQQPQEAELDRFGRRRVHGHGGHGAGAGSSQQADAGVEDNHIYWQVEGMETTAVGAHPQAESGGVTPESAPPPPTHPPPVGRSSAIAATVMGSSEVLSTANSSPETVDTTIDSLEKDTIAYDLAASELGASPQPMNTTGPPPRSKSRVSFAPASLEVIDQTVAQTSSPATRQKSILKTPDSLDGDERPTLFSFETPMKRVSEKSTKSGISGNYPDRVGSNLSTVTPVTPVERRAIAASMIRRPSTRKSKMTKRESREEAERERDKHFELLNERSDVFHHNSVVTDMASEGDKMEGVHPAHRDKFRMQSMLGTAIQSHETRKCAEHRDSRGKVGLTHSEAVAMHTDAVKRLDEVPTLCVSIQEKILLTQTLLHDIDGNKRALSQHSGLVGLIHLLGHFVLRTVHSYWRWTVELSTKSGLWRTRIKEIEGRHGSSSGVYFRALKWVFVMTVFQAIIWASMIFIPFGVFFGWNAHQVLVPTHKAPKDFSSNDNFVGIFTGGGFMNTSWYFIGGYTLDYEVFPTGESSSDQTVFINGTAHHVPGIKPTSHNYSLEVVYLLCTFAYVGVPLLFSLSALFGILRAVFAGADETAGPTNTDDVARFQLGKIIFASWEYSITHEGSVAMNQVALANAIRTVLTEAHFKELMAKKNKFILYSKRLIVEAIIIFMIIGGSWAVFIVTVDYSNSENDLERLYPSLLLTAINAMYPDMFFILGGLEDVHKATLTFLTLVRSQVMRVVTMYVFIYTLLRDREAVMCWESYIGAGFYNLFVISMLTEFLSSALTDYTLLSAWHHAVGSDDDEAYTEKPEPSGESQLQRRNTRRSVALARKYTSPSMGFAPGGAMDRKMSTIGEEGWRLSTSNGITREPSTVSYGVDTTNPRGSLLLKFLGPPAFNFKRHMIELVYQQTLLTFGMFFAPGLVAVALFRQVVNMYIKSWSTMKFCQVPRHDAFFAAHGLEAWVWLVFVVGIMVSAIPLAYVVSVDTVPCSGDNMPDSWQYKFFDVPAGMTPQTSCPSDRGVLRCSDCYTNDRNLTAAGCWIDGTNEFYNLTLAEVCALCPSGCGPFRNFATPYSSLVAASYDWPRGYQEMVTFVGTPAVGALVVTTLCLGLVYLWALAQGRKLKIKRLKLELAVHTQLINNSLAGQLRRPSSAKPRGVSSTKVQESAQRSRTSESITYRGKGRSMQLEGHERISTVTSV